MDFFIAVDLHMYIADREDSPSFNLRNITVWNISYFMHN
jgi:hypothetical protein